MDKKEIKEVKNFIADLLLLQTPTQIIFDENWKTPAHAGFRKDGKVDIIINPTYHENVIKMCIVHELRHVYQWEVCNDKNKYYSEPKELIEQWKDEFENPKLSIDDGYEQQELEIDAHAFHIYIMKVCFDVLFDIPEKFNEFEIIERIKKIMEDFPPFDCFAIASYIWFDGFDKGDEL